MVESKREDVVFILNKFANKDEKEKNAWHGDFVISSAGGDFTGNKIEAYGAYMLLFAPGMLGILDHVFIFIEDIVAIRIRKIESLAGNDEAEAEEVNMDF